MTVVYDYYQDHEAHYNYIQNRLDRTRKGFLEADRATQSLVLFLADMYSLISANTRVDAHEAGYIQALEANTVEEYRKALAENNVMYYNNKARYIDENLATVDYETQALRLEAGELDAVHRIKVDDVLGLRIRKGAFALAILGFTDKLCIDANVASYFDLDPQEDVYNGVVIDRYERQCGRLRQYESHLASETTPFVFQWVIFDCARVGEPTMHDAWFGSIADKLGIQLL